MALSGKFVWASSSLFFLFPFFFPLWSVAMLHKWDLILLPWLQSFSGALKASSQVADMLFAGRHRAASDQLQKSDIALSLSPWFWWLWEFMVLHEALMAASCFFSVLKTQMLQNSCRECCNFVFHPALPSSSIVKATERPGSSEGLKEQPVAVWMHRQTGEQLSTALQITVPN